MIIITEAMLSTGQPVSQGEVNLWKKEYAPKELLARIGSARVSEQEVGNEPIILGHSETGHHHVLEPADKTIPVSKAVLKMLADAEETFVELELAHSCELNHQRGNDTHQSFLLPPGKYVRVLREEQSVEGWRRVAD